MLEESKFLNSMYCLLRSIKYGAFLLGKQTVVVDVMGSSVYFPVFTGLSVVGCASLIGLIFSCGVFARVVSFVRFVFSWLCCLYL